jgi:peptide/nickel transport system substrate-binding protein
LRAVGLDAHLETMEIGALIARVQQTFRYEACLLALSGAVDPAVGLSVWHSSGEMHQFHPSQPAPATAWEREVDSLLTASVETVALDERKRLFDRVQELYAINLGWIFLANDNTFLAVRNRFGNVRPGTLRAMNEFCWNEDELFIK